MKKKIKISKSFKKKEEKSNRIIIEPNTRMNSLDIKIPLSDWCLDITKSKKQDFEVSLNLGSMRLEEINEIINFIEKNLFDIKIFGVKDRKRIYKFKLAKSKYLFNLTPPVIIKSLERGNIINSISVYDISFIFKFKFGELLNLINCLSNRTSKDLEYFFEKSSLKHNKSKVRKE